jgi:Cytochrome c oxidase subunit IV
MDGSSQSASYTSQETGASLLEQHSEGEHEGEASPHIHLPNPSYWPILLGASIAVTMIGLVTVSISPLISLIGLILVFLCIMGWAFEDPMAKLKDVYVAVRQKTDPWKFKIGMNVLDSQMNWLGKVEARFSRHILVERGRLFGNVYYVPLSVVRDEIKNNTIVLTVSEEELLNRGCNTIPDDLHADVPEYGVPVVRGAAQFARRPLSPAETGHYAYGRRSPGMNTDASGSYHRSEVLPRPQTYVTEDMYATDEPIPARAINPD